MELTLVEGILIIFTICNGFSPSIDYLFVLLTRVGRVALIWYGP